MTSFAIKKQIQKTLDVFKTPQFKLKDRCKENTKNQTDITFGL